MTLKMFAATNLNNSSLVKHFGHGRLIMISNDFYESLSLKAVSEGRYQRKGAPMY
jgi:hypothetical protein